MSKVYFYSSLIIVLLSLFILPVGGSVLAADTSIVSISSPDETIVLGQTFTVEVNVIPNHDIVGIQLNIAFDPKMMAIENIAEGDFLSRNGAATFFNPGHIDDTDGTVQGVFAAILSPGETVSSPGVVAILTCKALGSGGYGSLTLSNVIVGSVEGLPIPTTMVNGSIYVKGNTSSSGNTGGNGGTTGGSTGSVEGSGGISEGGSSGGAASGNKRFTLIAASASADGTLWDNVTASSVDMRAWLDISRGTVVLNANGYPPSSITATIIDDLESLPSDYVVVGNIYDFSPDGVTIEPSANLTLCYEEADLPEGVDESHLAIATLNETTGVWEPLVCSHDPENNCLVAGISHFSQYAVIAGVKPAAFGYNGISMSTTNPLEYERVMVSTIVANEGDMRGTTSVVFVIDGVEIARRDVTLDAGQRTEVNFLFTAQTLGTHVIEIGPNISTYKVSEYDSSGYITGATQTGEPTGTIASQSAPGASSTDAAVPPKITTVTAPVFSMTGLPALSENDTFDWSQVVIAIACVGLFIGVIMTIFLVIRNRH